MFHPICVNSVRDINVSFAWSSDIRCNILKAVSIHIYELFDVLQLGLTTYTAYLYTLHVFQITQTPTEIWGAKSLSH